MEGFSEELIRQRARRGWSRAMQVRRFLAVRDDLRIRAGTNNPENISRNFLNWERGVLPDPLSQVVLAVMHGRTLVGMFGDQAALNHLGLMRPALINAAGGKVELPYFAQAEDDPMRRRLFLSWMMRLSAGAAVLPEAFRKSAGLTEDDPDPLPAITMRDVAALDACHDTFMKLSYSVGAVARKAVLGQLSFATDQLRAGVPGSTEALNAWRILTARLCSTASWMSVDAGRVPQAQVLAALACETAASIEGRQSADAATGFFTAKFADVAINTGRPRTALELADQAQSLARNASPTTRHAIHAIKAEAYGALGEIREIRRELELADEIFVDISDSDMASEPWAWYYRAEGRREFNRATAQSRLVLSGPGPHAASMISEICDSFEASAMTWASGQGRARFCASARLRAASTLLVGREPDEAVAVGRQALPVLPALRSARVRDDVHDVVRAAVPFRRRPAVAALLHDLTTATD